MVKVSARDVNQKVLGNIPPQQMQKRRLVAAGVLVAMAVAFGWMIVSIWRYFTLVASDTHRNFKWRKFVWGYLLLAPGVLLVAWWQYLPLAGGLPISFMDFRLVRDSAWVGLDNFAMVLYDEKFWGGLGRTLYFVSLMIGLGFWPPILLAILLQEVPTDTLKYIYRTIFYLPAVISGIVVVFLWKQLYNPSEAGVLNQLLLSLNAIPAVPATLVKWVFLAVWLSLIALLTWLPAKVEEMALPLKVAMWGVAAMFLGLTVWPVIGPLVGGAGADGASATAALGSLVGRFRMEPLRWTESPELAMLCVVIPAVWAGSGPGCILYLAALKTVPDELYEAADIDGASNWHKVFYIVLPRLKYLIGIQFIAAVIGAFKGGTEFVLVMTGGGPRDATMLLSLEIFIRTFLDLKYGIGTAMAWILGAILIGFTAYQLRMLSRAEFRASGS
jgi:multiple sugar transport system permease protein